MLRVAAPVALLDHESWRPWQPSVPPSDRQYTAQSPVVIVNRRSRSKHRSNWRVFGWPEVRHLKIVPLHDPLPRPGRPRLPGPLQRLPAGILPPTAPEAHQTFTIPSRVLHSEGLSCTAEALGPRSCSKPWCAREEERKRVWKVRSTPKATRRGEPDYPSVSRTMARWSMAMPQR